MTWAYYFGLVANIEVLKLKVIHILLEKIFVKDWVSKTYENNIFARYYEKFYIFLKIMTNFQKWRNFAWQKVGGGLK